MQAITTRFLAPTNFHGSRIVARCDAGRVTIPWDHSIGADENHDHACETLCQQLNWKDLPGQWHGGNLPKSDHSARCYIYVRSTP